METMYFELLRDYCDALISLQIRNTGDKCFDGAFRCRACHILHGRAADAVYPLMVMAKRTGDDKYVQAAKAVFEWGENFVCDDGAIINDGQSTWKGITVFNTVAVCEALNCGGHLLDDATRAAWEARLRGMSEWLFTTLDENFRAVINYPATNTAALALAGKYFGREDYLKQARHLADYVMERITENGFLYGESHPRDGISPLGCRPIDMGYNMEESIPALIKYAHIMGDEAMLDRLTDVLRKQLAFMLPDGAWDNSFGIRNNKWTYWGSRTSDGCVSTLTLLADRDPVFAEAARRSTELLRACTYDGLLYGGPHYRRHGEHACTHHTFEHANAIAYALEHSASMPKERIALPCDNAAPLKHYPEVNVYKMAAGDYRATVTGYDFGVGAGKQSSGGTLSLVWKYGVGPMIAASVVDYVLVEEHNMQLSRQTAKHRSLTPRLEIKKDGVAYSTAYFTAPQMTGEEKDGQITVTAITGLCDKTLHRLDGDIDRKYTYTLSTEGMHITVTNAGGASLLLPVISGEVQMLRGKANAAEDIFFLTGGFTAKEYTIAPDENGTIELILK